MAPHPRKKAAEKPMFKSTRVAAAFSKIREKMSENPFDRFANAKKKHEVINRKVKGEDRNVGRARAKVFKYCIYMIYFSILSLLY